MDRQIQNLDSLSVVVPVFNEEDCIEQFMNEVRSALSEYKSWEVIFVDDGSTDDSWEIIKGMASEDNRVRAIRLTRNFGHQIAVMAGLENAKLNAIGIIDADLQDPPHLLPKLHDLISDQTDIVYGKRSSRQGETWFKRSSAVIFYRVFRKLVPFDIPLDTGDFRVVSKRVRDRIVAMNEQEPFLRGLFALTGYGSKPYEYERNPRFAGKSKYNLAKMIRLAANALLTFSDFPFRVFTKLSLVLLTIATVAGLWAITSSITGDSTSGWLSIFALILFFGALNIFFSVIVGLYVLQALKASRARPIYFVSSSLND